MEKCELLKSLGIGSLGLMRKRGRRVERNWSWNLEKNEQLETMFDKTKMKMEEKKPKSLQKGKDSVGLSFEFSQVIQKAMDQI